VSEAIEPFRRDKIIGSSLAADVTLNALESMHSRLADLDLAELFICANVNLRTKSDAVGSTAAVTKTTHHKCGRCWRHLPEVTEDGALCGRCEDVLNG
jgi:isoleucyl-tRNA synthetase